MLERKAMVTDMSTIKPEGRRMVWLQDREGASLEHAASLGFLILELLAHAAAEGVDTAVVAVRLTGETRGS
jgi:hypothetical protein